MKINTVKIVCFSPTGTTKTIVESIANGLSPEKLELIDITKPSVRKEAFSASADELLIIGVPVYMGRIPELVGEWFSSFKANNTPTVCIVVYGNRAYENSLKELKDIVTKCGGRPLACGAYIAEHSFSTPELPTAHNRPDHTDISHAEAFGEALKYKLQSLSSSAQISDIESPGNYPYNGATQLWDVDFISVNADCIQCGLCSEGCPVEAINTNNSAIIDIKKCLTCCACIKRCPHNARSIKPGPVNEARLRLFNLYNERKEPEMYL